MVRSVGTWVLGECASTRIVLQNSPGGRGRSRYIYMSAFEIGVSKERMLRFMLYLHRD